MRVHDLAERGLLPDALVRLGIRRRLHERLREQEALPEPVRAGWLASLRNAPISAEMLANPRHYDVSPRFFEAVLGPRQKYSAGYWPRQDTTLAEAEEAMLALQEAESRYARHSQAARAIAREYFDSGKVLARLVDDALGPS